MFRVLFQVCWKFNFPTETIRNTLLESSDRIALIELEHRIQSHKSYIFVWILQIHAKSFRIPTLYVNMNNLELGTNIIIRDKADLVRFIWTLFYLFFSFVLTLSANIFQFETKSRNSFLAKTSTGCHIIDKFHINKYIPHNKFWLYNILEMEKFQSFRNIYIKLFERLYIHKTFRKIMLLCMG